MKEENEDPITKKIQQITKLLIAEDNNIDNGKLLFIFSQILDILQSMRIESFRQDNENLNLLDKLKQKVESMESSVVRNFKLAEEQINEQKQCITDIHNKLNDRYISVPIMQQVMDKIETLEQMARKKDGIDDGENLISTTLILIGGIKEKIIKDKRVTENQLNELNKIYKTLRRR